MRVYEESPDQFVLASPASTDAETVKHLLTCGFRVVYSFTESDEISLLFHPDENTFGRKTRKLNSILAGEASAVFSPALGRVAAFDCRLAPLPNLERVLDHFLRRQEAAHRNALNAHCYWPLHKEGVDPRTASQMLDSKSIAEKNELLFSRGINYNDLPACQKRGIGIYHTDRKVYGFDPGRGSRPRPSAER